MDFLPNINYGNLMIVLGIIWAFNTWILSQFKHLGSKIDKIDVELYKTNETVTKLDQNLSRFQEELKSGSVKIAEKKKRKYVRKEKIEKIGNS